MMHSALRSTFKSLAGGDNNKYFVLSTILQSIRLRENRETLAPVMRVTMVYKKFRVTATQCRTEMSLEKGNAAPLLRPVI